MPARPYGAPGKHGPKRRGWGNTCPQAITDVSRGAIHDRIALSQAGPGPAKTAIGNAFVAFASDLRGFAYAARVAYFGGGAIVVVRTIGTRGLGGKLRALTRAWIAFNRFMASIRLGAFNRVCACTCTL